MSTTAKPVDIITVATDFVLGRREYERANGKGMYPGSAWSKAATALAARKTRNGGPLVLTKTGAAFFKQIEGIGATVAADIVAYLSHIGLLDAQARGQDVSCAYTGGVREDNYTTQETPWSYKQFWNPNNVAREGEDWVKACKQREKEARAAEKASGSASSASASTVPLAGKKRGRSEAGLGSASSASKRR
jgi:hypothetical protein